MDMLSSPAPRQRITRTVFAYKAQFLAIALLGLLGSFAMGSAATVPSAEKLLPDDTLVLFTVPDFSRLRDIHKSSPQWQLWSDPAMKPFKDKFLAKWKNDLVEPLERELNIRLDDYFQLLQGQLTFALTQNGWSGKSEQTPGLLLLLDARNKADQLKTTLADFRKKWEDARKPIKTEKILNRDFLVLSLSTNDVPKTVRKLLPEPSRVQEEGDDTETKVAEPKTDLVFGQVDSLLIVASSTKVAEKVVIRLTGGSSPILGDVASYQADHLALFRNSPMYGWINAKSFVDILTQALARKKEPSAPSPMPPVNEDKILSALGLTGLKTLTFSFQNSSEGYLYEFFAGVPESGRQGLFKILAGENKDFNPPAFVPADAIKFQRWRIDGQKTWAAIERMLNDISPQAGGYIDYFFQAAGAKAKEKDPDFDLKKNLIGNLGDDVIVYEKAAKGTSLAALKSPPSLVLIGSPNPTQLAAAFKSVFTLMPGSDTATEREFLGRKIFTMPAISLPLPMADTSRSSSGRSLNYAAGTSYVALSADVSMLEEYLRSADSQGKTLRATPGLAEATQKVAGPGTTLFGYENQAETMRAIFELFRQSANSSTNLSSVNPLAAFWAAPGLKEWLDFSLLPSFDKVSKYFYYTVYAGTANVDGLALKMYAPTPPALRSSAK